MWATAPEPPHDMGEGEFRKLLYREGAEGIIWRLKLAIVACRSRAADEGKALEKFAGFQRLLSIANSWRKPQFPVSGKDLLALGFEPGVTIGQTLADLERKWVESGFSLPREKLMEMAAAAR